MKLATLGMNGAEHLCLRAPGGYLPLDLVNRAFGTRWPVDLLSLLVSQDFYGLWDWYRSGGIEKIRKITAGYIGTHEAVYAPLYRHPSKIWGIGLNYVEHAADLSENAPTGIPASFMKPDTALIGCGDTIVIPAQSQRTTAEAELGVIIGRPSKHLPEADWLAAVAGFTTVIDMTAEDILRQNPRYLTLSKCFDTFFSFGPEMVTPDEVPDISRLVVETVINGKVHARNEVANMTFTPGFLVAFHSAAMTLLPGDVISTGTPGAEPIRDGDSVACRITGFVQLNNRVKDGKSGMTR
jgi:2-keto-4-pentenoate hydratase/2-oxohepta-3-ene-1,7-dioic acid hydratase in catechol pathway